MQHRICNKWEYPLPCESVKHFLMTCKWLNETSSESVRLAPKAEKSEGDASGEA